MDALDRTTALLTTISGIIWSEYLLIPLLVLVGIYLTVGLRAFTWRHIPQAFALLWHGRRGHDDATGEISPFQALMTALAATVGTGNIAGVATAIYLGGPGAVFWMWVIALFGMATKYGEAVLAVRYREVDSLGNHVGGPMYYIRNGLGRGWAWLGTCFALFGMVAAFGIGNLVQSNSVAAVMHSSFGISVWATGLVAAALTATVIIGGVRRIARVAEAVVPVMAVLYVGIACVILALHIKAVPVALTLIVKSAFTPVAGTGGFAGATVWMALRWGFARGIFSNEAGLGSAAIAHAAAQTRNPVEQGMIAMLGTFIDTLCICTMTALVILVTGAWTLGEQGASMSAAAFTLGIGDAGATIVGLSLAVFAFTTTVGWSYYGERCAEYLFGVGVIYGYRIIWIIAIMTGAVVKIDLVWTLADIFNGLMAMPNLIALTLLSPVIFKMTRAALLDPAEPADASVA